MSALPIGWGEITLDAIGKWRGGGTPSKHNPAFWTNGRIPWVSPKDMKQRFIADAEDHITSSAVEASATQIIPEQSVLIVTRSGILRHSLPVAVNTRDVAINQDLKAVSPTKGVDTAFLAFQLVGEAQEILRECAKSGTTVDSIDFEKLKAHIIKLAPLPEQRRIVAKIDSLSGKSKRARESLDHVPRLVEKYKQAVLAVACKGSLTRQWRRKHQRCQWLREDVAALQARRETYLRGRKGSRLRELEPADRDECLPRTWLNAHIAETVDILVGFAFKSSWYHKDGVKLLRGANIAPGKVTWDDLVCLPAGRASEFSEYKLLAGDIVIAMDRPLISTGFKIAQIKEEDAGALLVQRVARVRSTKFVHPAFVWLYLNSAEFISDAVSAATGSELPHISSNDILSARMPLPPLPEQIAIASHVERAFSWIDRLAAEATSARKLVDRLDQAILSKAFRGELVPQDPNDEPASVLLDRIGAERAANATKSKATKARKARAR